MAHIDAFSLDFDGCFGVTQRGDLSSFLDNNHSFIDYFKRTFDTPNNTRFLVGSTRQELGLDITGDDWNGNGLSFYLIPKLAQHLNSQFDNFMIVDPLLNLPFGTAHEQFRSICQNALHIDIDHDKLPTHWKTTLRRKYTYFKGYHLDQKKLDIIYGQAHKLAKDFPDDTITLHFYDDRIDILNSLNTYLSKHPYCLPHNVTLSLNLYEDGQHRFTYTPITGTGGIDAEINKTLRQIMNDFFASSAEYKTKQSHSFFSPQFEETYADFLNNPKKTFLKDRVLIKKEVQCDTPLLYQQR